MKKILLCLLVAFIATSCSIPSNEIWDTTVDGEPIYVDMLYFKLKSPYTKMIN